MATDAHDSRRKHRRSSSPEEIERSSKRHKRRHERHRHESKKRDEDSKYEGETVPSHTAVPVSGPYSLPPLDDVEEGEILEEGDLGGRDDEVGKKKKQSDGEPGEIEVTGDRDVRSDKANLGLVTEQILLHHEAAAPVRESEGINGKNSKSRSEYFSNDIIFSPALDADDWTCHKGHIDCGIHEDDAFPNHSDSRTKPQDAKDARASADGLDNEYLESKSSKGHNRQKEEPGCFKGNEKLNGGSDGKALEANVGKVNYCRNSSSESGGEKYRMSGSSLSQDRYGNQSRSSGHTRDRSRSRSIVEENAYSKRRHFGEHGAVYYAGRHKNDYDLDEERKRTCRSEHGHGNTDLVVDDRREHSTNYDRREAHDRSRTKDSDIDRDLQREEKQEETSRKREVNWVHRRERDHERNHERDRRDVEKDRSQEWKDDRDRRREKERDRSWEMVFVRDRRRERERDRSRDRTRGGERIRNSESERDDKNREGDNIKERERRDDRNGHKDRDTVNGKDKHLHHEVGKDNGDRYRKHSRHEETEFHWERKRNSEPVKVYNSRGSAKEEDESKLERGEDEQDEYDEKVSLQLPEQEEDDLNRIKEESRRRRETILEKYKKKQQQQQQHVEKMPENEKKVLLNEGPVDIPTFIPEALDSKKNGVDDAETAVTVGKSPLENVNVALEKISGAGGLGEGTPKSERSDDKFCDDIFGETPTGVRKSGKGDGLRIERGGLRDNWDDAEGYYSYHFGEILDGRYEVTAAHGRGVFSTVVRAKNLKIGNGEPEEVAIKIIRNNDTMYKAGMDELVILKKLVGADPDDKRHCVRFLSSFKYRNHLCLVFESLHMNLREVLKKFGRNIGLRLDAVKAYAKQLFIALKHLRNCGVLHCDIKPDNMLVNEAKNVLKLCDFGNSMFAGKNEVTPYLVSRFYRAPEIILGLQYDHPLDIWSVGCCLYELYTGKVLFPGSTNNDVLRLHMELKGPFQKKMLRKGAFTEQHFDQDLNFLATKEDSLTKRTIKRLILNIKPKDIGTIITSSPGEDANMLAHFKDLLEKVFVLDPDKRLTVSQALNHPFITGK